MTELEGKMSLNVEASNAKANGVFVLAEDELDNVVGGARRYGESYEAGPGTDLDELVREEGPHRKADRADNGFTHVGGKYGGLNL